MAHENGFGIEGLEPGLCLAGAGKLFFTSEAQRFGPFDGAERRLFTGDHSNQRHRLEVGITLPHGLQAGFFEFVRQIFGG